MGLELIWEEEPFSQLSCGQLQMLPGPCETTQLYTLPP